MKTKSTLIKFDKQYIYYYGGEYHLSFWLHPKEHQIPEGKLILSLKHKKRRVLVSGQLKVWTESVRDNYARVYDYLTRTHSSHRMRKN